MRLPIQYALLYPERVSGPTRRLNWREMGPWQFEQPNRETFPALDLGFEVARKGGSCGAVLNAANEASVGRFLANELRFLDIPRACRQVLANHNFSPNPSLNELRELDHWARRDQVDVILLGARRAQEDGTGSAKARQQARQDSSQPVGKMAARREDS